MFTLDASQLTTFQRCRRRWLLERSWEVVRWRPRSLLAACLREGVRRLSELPAEADPSQVAATCRTRFLSVAANPGLDLPENADPYQIASDLCAVLSTTLTALQRALPTTLTTLKLEPPVELSSQLAWLPLAFSDPSGMLHRYTLVDSWDSDAIAREVHGWKVIGDMAATGAAMTLHVIVIGQRRGGRQHSPWCRAWQHPAIAGLRRFQRPDGKGGHRPLAGAEWRAVWLSDLPSVSAAEWLSQMDADGVTPMVLQDHLIAPLSETIRTETLRQICLEAEQMAALVAAPPSELGAMSVPMSRPACDGWTPCPFQAACYRDRPAEGIGDLGLYRPRRRLVAEASASSPRCDLAGVGAS